LSTTNTLQVRNFTIKVLSEVFLMIFVFLCSLLHAIIPKFPNIFVDDSYCVRPNFEKSVPSQWAVSDYHFRVSLHQSDCKKCYRHLKIYTDII
jgi:hypothetical protein